MMHSSDDGKNLTSRTEIQSKSTTRSRLSSACRAKGLMERGTKRQLLDQLCFNLQQLSQTVCDLVGGEITPSQPNEELMVMSFGPAQGVIQFFYRARR